MEDRELKPLKEYEMSKEQEKELLNACKAVQEARRKMLMMLGVSWVWRDGKDEPFIPYCSCRQQRRQ